LNTFQNGENYLIRFKISNSSPIFDLIQFKMKNTIRLALMFIDYCLLSDSCGSCCYWCSYWLRSFSESDKSRSI